MCQTTCSHMFRIDIIDSNSSCRWSRMKKKPNWGKLWQNFAHGSCSSSSNVTFSINWPGPGQKSKIAGEALIPKPMRGCASRQNDWATSVALDLFLCPGMTPPTPGILELLAKTKAAKCQWSAEMRITLKSSHTGQTGARTHTTFLQRPSREVKKE